jgi:hypothetical protein
VQALAAAGDYVHDRMDGSGHQRLRWVQRAHRTHCGRPTHRVSFVEEAFTRRRSDGQRSGAAIAVAKRPDARADELSKALEEIRAMLGRGEVERARNLAAALERRWPESEGARYFARVLAPPTTRSLPGEQFRQLTRENAWLTAHAREYPGCWIAVHGDRLIAAHPDLRRVLASISPQERDAVLFFQPEDPAL